MKLISKIIWSGAAVVLLTSVPRVARALDPTYSLDYLDVEGQSGFKDTLYEVAITEKLERGVRNFFMGWLELPHGIKTEYYYRKKSYLNPGAETFVLGVFRGTVKSFYRMGVGLFECFTFPMPQQPVLEDMSEWLY